MRYGMRETDKEVLKNVIDIALDNNVDVWLISNGHIIALLDKSIKGQYRLVKASFITDQINILIDSVQIGD